MSKIKFEDYVGMIRKRAHYYSRIYNVEYEELEAQGFMIYCMALKNYDVTKSSFSTHLFTELNRIKDYCYTLTRNRQYEENIEDCALIDKHTQERKELQVEARKDGLSLKDFLEACKCDLSENAYQLMKFIVERTWEREGKRIPSIGTIVNVTGWKRKFVEKYWVECENYWNDIGVSLYS